MSRFVRLFTGGRDGSNPLAILAGLALAFFSFGMVQPFVAGLFGKTAGLLAGGLTMMLGGQLISQVFSPSTNDRSQKEQNQTNYQWGELQSITSQGAVIPITYGTIRTAGQILNQHITVRTKNEDGDEAQFLEVLLSGGEGIIDEFSDIRVNDNPIENYNDPDDPNSHDAEYFTRNGTNEQLAISGFENLYDSQAVNVILNCAMDGDVEKPMEAGEWHTVTLTGNTAEAVEVYLDFPEGLAFYRQNGDIDIFWVCMQFQTRYKIGSGSWSEWKEATEISPSLNPESGSDFINPETGNKRGTITGGWRIKTKATTPISRVKKIILVSEGQIIAGAEIQVRGRTFAKGATKDNQKCRYKVQWSTVTAVIPSRMTHPNKALVAVRIKATDQLNGGMPTITWRQTRHYVWVYDGGTWVQKDAQNPAWIIYDLCVRAKKFGSKIHVTGENPSRIDLPAFKAWAAWNDRTLDNRPPLKMNLLIDDAKSLFEWCNDIAASARGAVVLRGTKISCIFDAPSDPVQMFTTGNIIAGSFSGEFLPVEDRANAVEISFNNQDNNFEREQITVYANGFDDEDTRANPVSIDLTGITTFEQAYAEGWYRLLQNKYILRTISFKAEIDALPCTVGDVIKVQHDVPMWGQGGRILRKISDNIFMLDKEIIFDPSKNYDMNIRRSSDDKILTFHYYDDFMETSPEYAEPGVTYLAIAYPNGIDAGDIFSVGEVNKVTKPFRIQEIKLDADLKADITCTEYIAELYTQSTDIPVIDYTDDTKKIVNLHFASTGHYSDTGVWTPGLFAVWNYLGTRPVGYEFQYAINSSIWSRAFKTSDNTAQIPTANVTATYHIRVRALYVSGLPSEWAYADFESEEIANAFPPDPPSNLTVEGWFGFALLTWKNPVNRDLHHIEIWEADQDGIDNAVLVGTTRATSYTRLFKTGGALWFWVRAVNSTGQVSEFNQLAGTPCIISPEDFQTHEEFIQELLENNSWLQDIFDELDQKIEPLETELPKIEAQLVNIDDIKIPTIENDIANIRVDISDIKEIQIPSIELDISGIKDITVPSINANLEHLAEGIINNASSIEKAEDERRKGIAIAKQELYKEITETNEAIAGYRLELLGRIEDNTALITSESEARANADEVEAHEREVLAGKVGINAAAIETEQSTRANADAALTQRLDTLSSTVGTNTAAIQTEAQTRANADSTLSTRIDTLGATVDSNTAAIQEEKEARADADSASAYERHELQARLNNLDEAILNNASSISNEGEQRRQDVALAREELRAEITAEREARATRELELLAAIDGNSSAIQQEQQARANAIEAEAHSREILESKVNENTSAIRLEASTRATEDEAISKRIDTLVSRVGENEAAIEQEAKTRADADSASAYSRQELQARLNSLDDAVLNNSASITNEGENRRTNIALAREELHAEITAEKIATAKRELELYTAIEANASAIQQEQLARTDAISSEAHSREILESKVNTNTAAIQTEAQTRAAADSATANTIQTLRSDVNSNASAIQTEQTARATADGALSSRIDTLVTEVDNNAAAILKEQETRVDHENAAAYDKREIQARLTNLDDAVLNNAATIQETGEARRQSIAFAREELHAEITAEGVARAKRELELSAAIEANSSAIQEEQTARANADSAEAQARQNLATQVGVNRNLIDQEVIARTNADSALSTRTSILENTVNNSTTGLVKRVTTVETSLNGKASISDVETLQTVVGNSNSGLVKRVTTLESDISGKASVSSVETLQTTVSGHTTSIQTLNSVKNGVTGRHYVKIDNNGYVVGTELYNGGADQSSFVVSADHFNVRNPKNANNIFDYNSSTGTLTIRNLVADSAIIQDASIMRAKIGSNQITAPIGYISASGIKLTANTTTTLCTITSPCEKNAVILFSGILFFEANPSSSYVSTFANVEIDLYYVKNSTTTLVTTGYERIAVPFNFRSNSYINTVIPFSARYEVVNNISSAVFRIDVTYYLNTEIGNLYIWVGNINALTIYR